MTSRSVDELLEAMLDDVIELTGAARGVVLLVDPGDGEGQRRRACAPRATCSARRSRTRRARSATASCAR